MNENQLWYCVICDETIDIENYLKHVNSKAHKHKEKYGIVFKENEIFEPKTDEREYELDNVITNCKDNIFHTFEYRCVHDIQYINVANDGEVVLTKIDGYNCLKPEIYGLNKKIEVA